jgi:hypothetical protein
MVESGKADKNLSDLKNQTVDSQDPNSTALGTINMMNTLPG